VSISLAQKSIAPASEAEGEQKSLSRIVCRPVIKNDSSAILSGGPGNVVCHETVMKNHPLRETTRANRTGAYGARTRNLRRDRAAL
jgi:hypothetical protein